MKFPTLKPRTLWMVRSYHGFAPFYGCHFTRKAMKHEFEKKGWILYPDLEFVKVTVTMVKP
jgi:hypothetical protein